MNRSATTNRTTKLVIAYALIAVALVPINTGVFYADLDAVWNCGKWAREKHRERLGSSLLLGILYSALWPVATPAAWMMTGFWERGIRYSPMNKEEREKVKHCKWDDAN